MEPTQSFLIEKAKIHFSLGLTKFMEEKWSEAEKEFALSLEYFPNRVSTLTNLIATKIKLNKYKDAEKLIDTALSFDPENPELYLNKGQLFLVENNFSEALANYEQAIKFNPDYSEAYNNRGIALKELKRFEDALNSFESAIKLMPDFTDAYINRGILLQEMRRFDEALINYNNIISIKPNTAEAYNNRGNIFRELKHLEDAANSYKRAIEVASHYSEAYYNLGIVLLESNQLEESLSSLNAAIEYKQDFREAYYTKGLVLNELGRHDEAVKSYDFAIHFEPNYPEALNSRGISLQKISRIEEAIASYDAAIEYKKDYAEAYFNKGIAQQGLGRFEDAISSYDSAIENKLNRVEVFYNRGIALQGLNQLQDAIASYDKALGVSPNSDGYYNRGLALHELQRYEEAIVSYQKAIDINSKYTHAFNNLGLSLHKLKRFDEAIASYEKAILIDKSYPEAYNNLGLALKESQKFEDALIAFDRCIKINPQLKEAYNHYGLVFLELKRYQEALENFDKAITISPNFAEAYNNRGILLQELKRLDEAASSFEKAFEIDPDFEFLLGTLIIARSQICDWNQYDQYKEKLADYLEAKKRVSTGFSVLPVLDSPKLQKIATDLWVQSRYPNTDQLGPLPKPKHESKIRIGYYSADFNEHPVAYLTAELYEIHDRSNFEIYGFYYGEDTSSKMYKRISSAFDHFYHTSSLSDKKTAELSRQLGIDIAIDLTGHTKGSRVGIFSFRLAPLQLSYIGYLGTMGAPYYDYLIADRVIIPLENQKFYSEKIIYLPSYQVNDSKKEVSDKKFTRTEMCLPDNGFVFCCFNNNYKITPEIFDSWVRILYAVPGSVLFLYAENKWAEENLKHEAKKRGLEVSRIIFAKRIKRDEYLARYSVADLFLDTSPYNAGTTASDALWVGLPVLTLRGESFASRVASSLLISLDLPELIAFSRQEYEQAAIALAKQPLLLNEIKNKLASKKLTSDLFNATLFTQNLERSYQAIYSRYKAGKDPENFYVEK